MAKRSKAPAAASAANTTPAETATETVAVEATENNDAEVLAALEASDQAEAAATEVVTETVEMIEVELESEDEDAVLAALAADEDDAAKATTTTKKSGPKSKSSSTPVTPVVTRQFCDVADHMDDTALKNALDGINAKKVSEKATNVVQAITAGKKLSGFTALAVKTLSAKGRVTAKDFVEAFQADGKSLGTARAQGQQMTALFKSLGIVTPDPSAPRELVMADNGLTRELVKMAS